MTGYISPFPVEVGPNYRNRIEGAAVIERMHIMPRSDGGEETCQPRACRECERERTWKEGQTLELRSRG
ncbi:MAG: hypothetical protein DI555_08065 [Novosphingobium pentaromativorans]|uniref:Uncharacterized protein n=1 Tax=Novosphingobium pentaromativorans TaxID=205844 RepID=A0A2W5QKU6_9SPHN|nr:MAG: hypothetical protein DI555_08065 [Novosphingobium pentaromativorans]